MPGHRHGFPSRRPSPSQTKNKEKKTSQPMVQPEENQKQAWPTSHAAVPLEREQASWQLGGRVLHVSLGRPHLPVPKMVWEATIKGVCFFVGAGEEEGVLGHWTGAQTRSKQDTSARVTAQTSAWSMAAPPKQRQASCAKPKKKKKTLGKWQVRCKKHSKRVVRGVTAHGSLVIPQTRNSIDRLTSVERRIPAPADFPGSLPLSFACQCYSCCCFSLGSL